MPELDQAWSRGRFNRIVCALLAVFMFVIAPASVVQAAGVIVNDERPPSAVPLDLSAIKSRLEQAYLGPMPVITVSSELDIISGGIDIVYDSSMSFGVYRVDNPGLPGAVESIRTQAEFDGKIINISTSAAITARPINRRIVVGIAGLPTKTVKNGTEYTIKPIASLEPGEVTGYFLQPCVGIATSFFGDTESRRLTHKGLDIAGGINTPIYAADGGTVIHAGWMNNYTGFGIHVIVDHGDGVVSMYCHLNKAAVAVGDLVGQGQLLGYMGSTGNSSGVHLHFEVRKDGTAFDPLTMMIVNPLVGE